MRRGWFKIPGVQDGDRTLEEQRLGVEAALAECQGKSVLDLGCAEGLLTREFALAGAAELLGVESWGEHLQVAQDICSRYRMVAFLQADLNAPPDLGRQFDIVLALGVCHKLHDPEAGVRWAAAACRGLALVRMTRYTADGTLTSKWPPHRRVNVTNVMAELGLPLERILPGPRLETVHYYRRP